MTWIPLADESTDYQEPVMEFVDYALWITLSMCAIGVIIVAAKIVMGYLDGNPQRESFGLLWVLGAALLALSATAIGSALLPFLGPGP